MNCSIGDVILKNRKERKKIIRRLLGKEPRKEKSLKTIFQLMLENREFSGPNLRKLGVKTSWFYNVFLPIALRKGMLEPGKTIKSAGRGQTQFYRPTRVGRMVAAYYLQRTDEMRKLLTELLEEEEHPVLKFALETFLGFTESEFWAVMDKIFQSVSNSKKISMEKVEHVFADCLFNFSIFTEGKIPDEEAKRRVELVIKRINQHPQRDILFWFFKLFLEAMIMRSLKGEKLKNYLEHLRKTPKLFHLPCLNEKCPNVIAGETLFLPTFCSQCSSNN